MSNSLEHTCSSSLFLHEILSRKYLCPVVVVVVAVVEGVGDYFNTGLSSRVEIGH